MRVPDTGRALVVALSLLTLAPAARACSISHCGDATYRLVGEDFFGARAWYAGVEVDRYSKDQVAEEDESLREREDETRIGLAAAWQPLSRVRLVGRVPFASRKITVGEEALSLTGVSDPEFVAHVRLTSSGRMSGRWAAVMLGVRTPWGQNEREVDGERAEEHLQPGTGASALLAGLSGSVRIGNGDHVYASVSGRWNSENDHAYRYGDATLASLTYARDLAPNVAALVGLDFRHSLADREDGADVEHTGGSVLYASPRVQWSLGGPAAIRVGLQVPVVRDLNGDQKEKVNILTGLSYGF